MLDAPAVGSLLLFCSSGQPGPIRQVLEADGFWVTVSHDRAEALWRLETLQPDLLVILTNGSLIDQGRDCQTLLEAGDQPTLALLEDDSVEARVAMLASGADDALSQPFHPFELVARARALLRRGPRHASPTTQLRHGDLELDVDGHVTTLGGQPLALTPFEFRLLRTLLEAPQRTFSRDELLARTHVFDERFSSERSIDLHVAELRRKLGDSASTPRYLETVRGVGYRLARAPAVANGIAGD
jgi:DNA-binding response OmpR family regulator